MSVELAKCLSFCAKILFSSAVWALEFNSLKIRKESLKQAATAGATTRALHTSFQHIVAQPYANDDSFLNSGPQSNRIRNEQFLT